MTDPIERAEVLRELDECIEQAGAANEGTWWLQEARDAIAALPAVKQETEPVAGGTVADRLDAMADRSPAGSQEQSDLYAAATIWRKHLVHRAAPPSADAEDAERLDWLTRIVSGAELRRIGVVWPSWSESNSRAAIDAARKREGA